MFRSDVHIPSSFHASTTSTLTTTSRVILRPTVSARHGHLFQERIAWHSALIMTHRGPQSNATQATRGHANQSNDLPPSFRQLCRPYNLAIRHQRGERREDTRRADVIECPSTSRFCRYLPVAFVLLSSVCLHAKRHITILPLSERARGVFTSRCFLQPRNTLELFTWKLTFVLDAMVLHVSLMVYSTMCRALPCVHSPFLVSFHHHLLADTCARRCNARRYERTCKVQDFDLSCA